jgi:hypothetical protein
MVAPRGHIPVPEERASFDACVSAREGVIPAKAGTRCLALESAARVRMHC